MELPLIAAVDWSYWGYLAQGVLALGLVILIHEFGHFAAAKLCGVKVLKFYIGFDPYNLRICRFRWGETEYGLGLIPLGGYVYMLGQTDNPAEQAAEAERAKAAAAAGEPVDPNAAAVWDPRSYPAQTVLERMFIISAGVIMNAVTALLFATLAYARGVDFPPTFVYGTAPGSPAWQADLRAGDEVTKIDGIEKPRWDVDLRSRVALADLQKGLEFEIRRGDEMLHKTIRPRKDRADRPPTIGVLLPFGTKLTKRPEGAPDRSPTESESPAARAVPPFEGGDEVVRINDVEIRNYGDVLRAETKFADQPSTYVVRRGEGAAAKEVAIEVTPRPRRDLGLSMTMGPIVAIQENSPAAGAGFRTGDVLASVDDEPVGDPLNLAERLRRKQLAEPGKAWTVVVRRAASSSAVPDVRISVTPRAAAAAEDTASGPGWPVSIPALGVAYSVGPQIASVVADGPAAKAGLKAGDTVTGVDLIPAKDAKYADGQTPKTDSISMTEPEDVGSWPYVVWGLQHKLPGTTVKLTLADKRDVTLTPVESKEFFYPDRGLAFEIPRVERKADGWAQAFHFGRQDTRDAMTQVYRFLHALWIGQIPAKALGGVIEIASQAGASASVGLSHLLLFLMMLSANLAVLNFLPIPVLDGGHMVFLIYEAIFRKPPPAALVNILSMLGLVLLLGLMLFALSNDIRRRI